jgi:hypothetical protein
MKGMVGLMYRMDVVSSGKPMTVACDGRCSKAWGICARPKEQIGTDEDDIALLADDELGDAPADPGEYEGGCAKPSGPHAMNKWCSRQCERSVKVARGEAITLPDFSKRLLNQPWKHQEEVR